MPAAQPVRRFQTEVLEDRNMPSFGVVSGCVFADANADGLKQAGEVGIPGVPVRLVDQATGASVLTSTDGYGNYQFNSVSPGRYCVVEDAQPAGFLDGAESIDGVPRPGSVGTDAVCDFAVDHGQTVVVKFGEVRPAALCGTVYVDADRNGVLTPGEQPLTGITLSLMGVDNTGAAVSVQTVTGADGGYCFTGLRPGTYEVCEPTQPAGFADGAETVGTVNGVATGVDDTRTDCIAGIALPPGGDGKGYNFGELPPVPPPPPVGETIGFEGLTPGFWKNNVTKQGAVAWAQAGVSTTTTVAEVFSAFAGTSLGNLTLVQALGTGGGGTNALLRHAVAAYLSAKHPAVDYAITSQQVVAAVNAAVSGGNAGTISTLAGQLDGWNNRGADLDQHGQSK